MSTVNVCTIVAESLPKSKKDPSTNIYSMMFVMPEDMGSEWVAARVKGTGKTPNLPDGMCLVWSLTHDAWRTLNGPRVKHFTVDKVERDSVEVWGVTHRTFIDSMPENIRALWNR